MVSWWNTADTLRGAYSNLVNPFLVLKSDLYTYETSNCRFTCFKPEQRSSRVYHVPRAPAIELLADVASLSTLSGLMF